MIKKLPKAGTILLLLEQLYPRPEKDQSCRITEAPLDANLQHVNM